MSKKALRLVETPNAVNGTSFALVNDTMFTDGTKAEVFNLGNPGEFTILQFAQEVLAVTGSRSPLDYRPLLFADDPTRRRD